MLANRFGHFDSSGSVYSITDPRTPMPWVNVVCNGRYGFVVSQNGGGFSWLDNSQLNVLTRWDMDLARDLAGRYLYLADLDSGEVWSAAPAPCFAQYESYRCDHTTGATTFRTEHSRIRVEWALAVAPADPVEVWSVALTNTGSAERRIRLASFFEWCCGVAPDTKREFHRLFFTTRHDEGRRAIFATKNMWDVPQRSEAEHWNRPWPYAAAHAVHGPFESHLAIADKRAFLGRPGDLARPEAMLGEAAASAGFGRFGDASAALGGDLRLAPGQTVRVHYLLTVADDKAGAEALLDRYRGPVACERAIAEATLAWSDRLSPTRVRTERPDFDLLNNTWLPYQAISGRLWGRTGYYQQSGAFGFRDQLQDSQVWLPLEPARCRDQILHHAAHQFPDGSVYHWWHPLTEMGLRTKCSDDFLWLPLIVCNYLKETADWAVLDEVIPFARDSRSPAGDAPESGTLLDHCLRSVRRGLSLISPRGLPLIGSCDWNDGLSALGVEGRGESVWLGFFLYGLLGDVARVMDHRGDRAGAADFRSRAGALREAINTHAWDGRWFKRATRDDGTWIGAADCAEGRIYLNSQTWAVLTAAADSARLRAAWDSVKEHLLADMGPLLLSPAYTQPDPSIGYITRYAPGLRENGGVYMHAATWALAAACHMKDAASAERIWASISPPERARDGEAYFAEPYVTPGNVDGPVSEYPGRAGWTWYTGSAAWLNRVSLERLLGVRAVWEGLEVNPCPPASLGRVDLTRTWRGVPVRIRFDARAFRPDSAPRLTVDGQSHDGLVLGPALARAASEEGRTIEVEVAWPPVAPAGRVRSAPAAAEGSAVR
jgi:cellobiose phosphorylase